jgi:hypothetical protein
MKCLLLVLTLISFSCFAEKSAECNLVNGIYRNSSTPLTELKFETLVDIFTLNNAKALTMNLDGEPLRFIRLDLDNGRQVKMIYVMKKNREMVRAIHLMIDRSLKDIARNKEFYGNMIISSEISDSSDYAAIISGEKLVYNFYCRF